jgi:hypothetical protein
MLGMTRGRARSLFRRYLTRGRRYMDFFCLAGGPGIRVGYPSPKLLRMLSPAARRRVQGRVVLALTGSRYYALGGVRPGARLAKVARHLGTGKGVHIGLNWWYLAANGPSRGVLKVRHGVIEEIGIANKQLTNNPRAAWRFLTSLRLTEIPDPIDPGLIATRLHRRRIAPRPRGPARSDRRAPEQRQEATTSAVWSEITEKVASCLRRCCSAMAKRERSTSPSLVMLWTSSRSTGTTPARFPFHEPPAMSSSGRGRVQVHSSARIHAGGLCP